MGIFAENVIRRVWRIWFQYVMVTLAIIALLLVTTLYLEVSVPGEIAAPVLLYLFYHHMGIFYLANWLENSGGVQHMSAFQVFGFTSHFYFCMVGIPIILIVSYLVPGIFHA